MLRFSTHFLRHFYVVSKFERILGLDWRFAYFDLLMWMREYIEYGRTLGDGVKVPAPEIGVFVAFPHA